MTLQSLRNRIQWIALGLSFVLLVLDTVSRLHYVAVVDSQYVDSTPRIVNQIWLLLIPTTLIAGGLSFPRVPSFVAFLSVSWVIFISIQGH
jgi:hypothetical protein